MVRFILICIVVIGFLVLFIPVYFVEWLIGKKWPMHRDIACLRMVQGAFKLILWLTGARITIIGEDRVPTDTAVLFIGNHRSFFDILLTYSRCKNRTGYVAKKEMEKIPLLSDWMRALHCLFIDRDNIREGLKTILAGIDKIKQGISITIFPEGTRSRSSDELEMLPFHEGSFKIATKTGCPIVPIAISNSSGIFEDHFPKIRPVDVIVEYCEPVYPEQLTKDEKKFVGKYVQGIIRETLRKNAAL